MRTTRFTMLMTAFLLSALAAAATVNNSRTANPIGVTGTATANDCVKFADSNGNVADSGSACGGTGTVTSVGVSSTGSTVTVTGSPITTSGTINVEVAALPAAIPAAGAVISTNTAAPSSPASGKDSLYTDSTDLRLHDKNASGVIGTTVVADTGAANNFLTGISAAGAISKAQPTPTNVGLGSVTNDAQTKAAVVPNTAPSAGQILAGNAGGTAYAPVTLSGSGATATLSSAGVLTLSAIPAATISTSTSGANIGLLNGANTYSGASTFSSTLTDSVAGAASTPGLTVSGVPFAGTGTTSFPQLYVNVNTATASTTMSTNGTALGVNSHGTSDLLNLMLDGATKLKVASDGTLSTQAVSTTGQITATTSMEFSSLGNGALLNGTKKIFIGTAPAIASGFGTSPSVVTSNGTAAFTINVGTGGSASSGVVTMPTATTGWACSVTPNAAPQAAAEMFSAPTSTTSITITNYTASTGVALAWPASAVLQVTCIGY